CGAIPALAFTKTIPASCEGAPIIWSAASRNAPAFRSRIARRVLHHLRHSGSTNLGFTRDWHSSLPKSAKAELCAQRGSPESTTPGWGLWIPGSQRSPCSDGAKRQSECDAPLTEHARECRRRGRFRRRRRLVLERCARLALGHRRGIGEALTLEGRRLAGAVRGYERGADPGGRLRIGERTDHEAELRRLGAAGPARRGG